MTPTLWRLHDAIVNHKNLSIKGAINLFDANGLISNHCVFLADIADVDALKCIEFLKTYEHPTPP
jgi:hypothetical protein